LLLQNRLFFQNVEELVKIVKPIKEVITSLEFKTTTLTDCFIQLIKLSVAVKIYQKITNPDFRTYCLEKFNTRWNQFDFKIYMLAYFLHPLYRGVYVEFIPYNIYNKLIICYCFRKRVQRRCFPSNMSYST